MQNLWCHHPVKSEWMSEIELVQISGQSKCEVFWVCLQYRWLKPRWEMTDSRWLSSSSSVRMNEFESEWISMSQSQSGWRVFLSESERRKQGVWIPQWQKLNPRWQNSRRNSRWPPSSSWVRMNEWRFFCSNGGEASVSEVFFVQMVGTNLGKCECVWEEKLRWLIPRWPNSRWQNSRWLPSSSLRMNEFESDWISLNQSQSKGRVFLSESERRKQGVWIPQCRSWIQDAEFKMGIINLENEWVWVRVN